MKKEQRAQQIWSVLIMAAKARQTLTYKMVSRLTGVEMRGIGAILFPIQRYCVAQGLPKLTALVVHEESGLPGDGLPLKPSEFPRVLQQVFFHDWFAKPWPTEVDFLAQKPQARR